MYAVCIDFGAPRVGLNIFRFHVKSFNAIKMQMKGPPSLPEAIGQLYCLQTWSLGVRMRALALPTARCLVRNDPNLESTFPD